MGKASENKLNFTKTTLLSLPVLSRQTYYWDTKTEGLGLGITPKGVKTFILYRRVNGKPVRLKLGRFPIMSVDQARTESIKQHAAINQGNDPRTAALEQAQAKYTLAEVYKDYLDAKPNLRAGTLRIYQQNQKHSFSDWWDKPLKNITGAMVQERHRRDGQKSQAVANQSMRMLRALFNFAQENYRNSRHESLYPHNPVEILSRLNSWYEISRRTTVVKQHQLKSVFWAMMAIRTERMESLTFRDYLLVCLFTGLRAREVSSLRIDQVDLEERSILLKGKTVKNKQDHLVPLSSFVFGILNSRIEQLKLASENKAREEGTRETPVFVFPSASKTGYFAEPRAACDPVSEASGVKFSSHDLRRTFITIAESLDISPYAWKQLVNHKIPKNDVSGGYVIPDLERLRQASQKICDFILEKVEFGEQRKFIIVK